MPRMDAGDHGGVGQGLSLEELLLHALVGIPEVGLMERGSGEQGTRSKAPGRREVSPALCHPPGVWIRQPPPRRGARSRFAGAGTRHAASAALCWLSPTVLGSPAARCSGLGTIPSDLGTTLSNLGMMPSLPDTAGGWSARPCPSQLPQARGRHQRGACVLTHTAPLHGGGSEGLIWIFPGSGCYHFAGFGQSLR